LEDNIGIVFTLVITEMGFFGVAVVIEIGALTVDKRVFDDGVVFFVGIGEVLAAVKGVLGGLFVINEEVLVVVDSVLVLGGTFDIGEDGVLIPDIGNFVNFCGVGRGV